MTAEIETSVTGAVQLIRLNRPAKKNALTEAMYMDLARAFEIGDRDPSVHAHAIIGAPGVFCAGNDIADFLRTAVGAGAKSKGVFQFLAKLPLIEKPVVAGVDGPAVGIGTTMLFHFDLIYATPGAQFSTPFVDLGIVPEAGSSLLMPARMGYARAFEMLGMGAVFSSERMQGAGLVNAIVPAPELEQKVMSSAMVLAKKSPEALAVARKLMRGDPREIQLRIGVEADAFAERLKSPEARKSFEAFMAKGSTK